MKAPFPTKGWWVMRFPPSSAPSVSLRLCRCHSAAAAKQTSLNAVHLLMCFPGGASGKDLTCRCRRCKRRGFSPRVGKIPWRRAWQPTPVFWPGESHGQRSLEGCSPWGLPIQTPLKRLSTDARICWCVSHTQWAGSSASHGTTSWSSVRPSYMVAPGRWLALRKSWRNLLSGDLFWLDFVHCSKI